MARKFKLTQEQIDYICKEVAPRKTLQEIADILKVDRRTIYNYVQRIRNLQYLTKEENRKKSNRLDWKKDE